MSDDRKDEQQIEEKTQVNEVSNARLDNLFIYSLSSRIDVNHFIYHVIFYLRSDVFKRY